MKRSLRVLDFREIAMRRTTIVFSALLALSVSGAGLAAGAMKPGLWEMTMKSDAMKAMPALSPQQMEQMRKAGVNMPQMQGGGMVTKVCISKEMAEREQPPTAREESGCQMKNYKRSGNTYSMERACDGPNMKGTGTVKGSYEGDSRFSSTYDFKGTSHGKPVNQHQETSGKWLSADCGNVKPAAVSAKK